MLSLFDIVMEMGQLQNFEQKQGLPYGIYQVLKQNGFDSRDKCDLQKVTSHIDYRDKHLFQ